MVDGIPQPLEYLEIHAGSNGILYRTTIPDQNAGQSIEFQMTQSDSALVFENPKHDFPQKISYTIEDENRLFVEINNAELNFSYRLLRQNSSSKTQDLDCANPNYDANLAEELGGDEFGMRSYRLVILTTGSNDSKDKALISEKFEGHLDNIQKLVEEGSLIVAGPFGENDDNFRGLFIFRVDSSEECEALLKKDPAIEAGFLDYLIYPWYSSAALSEYLDASDRIWKEQP